MDPTITFEFVKWFVLLAAIWNFLRATILYKSVSIPLTSKLIDANRKFGLTGGVMKFIEGSQKYDRHIALATGAFLSIFYLYMKTASGEEKIISLLASVFTLFTEIRT